MNNQSQTSNGVNTNMLTLTRGFIITALISFIVLAAFLLSMVPAQAASVDMYIKIGGVDGEAKGEYTRGVVGQTFVLDGSQSADDGTVRTYSWRQVSGPYKFDAQSGNKISVTPSVAGTYVFELINTDSNGRTTVINKVNIDVALENTGIEPDEIDYDGTQETNFGVLLDSGSSDAEDAKKKGNVEYGWKVEEGESLVGDDRAGNAESARISTSKIISKVEVRGWSPDQKQEFLAEVKAFAEVQSEQDLENFARGVLVRDENVEKIEFGEQDVRVAYKAKGRLLGFIPVSFTERTIASFVDGEVDVKVKLPWWSFLMRPDVDPNETAAATKDKHKSEIDIESWSWGTEARAQLLEMISVALKTRHDTAKNSISNVR